MRGIDVRKWVLLLALLCAACSQSEAGFLMTSQPDSCTGGLLFSWHMENATVTSGLPAGCSAGDTTASYASDGVLNTDLFYDGATSLDIPTDGDYAYFTVSGDDIINPSAGTITFNAYIGTLANNARFFSTGPDTNNYLRVLIQNTDEIRVTWDGNTTLVTITTTDANLPTSTWVRVVVRYTTADVDPNLSVKVLGYGTEVTSNTNLTAWAGANGTMVVGNAGAGVGDLHIDNVKVYNSWVL